jgi:hypothetical protein
MACGSVPEPYLNCRIKSLKCSKLHSLAKVGGVEAELSESNSYGVPLTKEK